MTAARTVFTFEARPFLLMAAALALLTGCAPGGTVGSHTTPVTGPSIAPLAASSATGQTPGQKAATIQSIKPIPTPMETFRALAPADGVKLTPLFGGPKPDEALRLKRLEDAVQSLRNDFDTTVPTLVRLVAMENDMQELIVQMRKINGQPDPDKPADPGDADATAAPVPPGAANGKEPYGPPAPGASKPAAPFDAQALAASADKVDDKALDAKAPDAKATNGPQALAPSVVAQSSASPSAVMPTAIVRKIRIANHDKLTRIVLDATAKPDYKAVLQKDGRQLAVALPAVQWNATSQKAGPAGTLVSSYSYEQGQLTLALRHAVTIKAQQVLPADAAGTIRLVIDLAAQ